MPEKYPMVKLKAVFLTLFFVSKLLFIQAQGCSDAGFCSIGDIKTNGTQEDSLPPNHLFIAGSFSLGQNDISYLNPYIEYGHAFNNRFNAQLKFTSQFSSGRLNDNFNLSDAIINARYLILKDSNKLSITTGIKLPLNNANAKNENGLSLPLEYQSSLGTVDYILGVSYFLKSHWEFSTALQLPVFNFNDNSFSPADYTSADADGFSPTNKFRRAPDILLRVGYMIKIGSRLKAKPNLLSIYHLANDSYEDAKGNKNIISGSAGITLNAGLILTYKVNKISAVEFTAAAPFVVREKRPDGLTRSVVTNFEYKIYF